MYHHRGAYLQALAMVGHTGLTPSAVHLWTLPMFHCNGWCFPWAVTAAAATHVCLPKVDPAQVWRLIRDEGVTHLNGAPTVLSMIAYAAERRAAGRTARAGRDRRGAAVAGDPAADGRARVRRHPPVRADRDLRPGDDLRLAPGVERPRPDAQARLKARQGVGNMISCTARVIAEDGSDVPADGQTTGQIALRGNNVMLGYLDDPRGDRRKRRPTAGSAPATSASCIPTGTSSCVTAART